MRWDDETMGVGHPMLDAERRILLDLLDQLQEAVETGQTRAVVANLITVLTEYADHHFRREVRALELACYPDKAGHAAQSGAALARLTEARDAYLAGHRNALVEDRLTGLKKILTGHILVADKAYSPWVEQAAAIGALSDLEGDPAMGAMRHPVRG